MEINGLVSILSGPPHQSVKNYLPRLGIRTCGSMPAVNCKFPNAMQFKPKGFFHMPSTINVNSTRPVTLIPSLPKIITQLFYTYIVYLIFSFFSRDYAQNFFTDSHGNMNYTKIFSRSSRHQQMFGKILVLTNFAKVPRQLLS